MTNVTAILELKNKEKVVVEISSGVNENNLKGLLEGIGHVQDELKTLFAEMLGEERAEEYVEEEKLENDLIRTSSDEEME